MRTEKYILRKAAGVYWLINIEQNGLEFESPMILNESGALIWMNRDKTEEEIAKILSEYYIIEKEEALQDVISFLNMWGNGDR